jgi:hypothetical protein
MARANRPAWIGSWVDALWQDVRHGVRSLRRSSAVVVISALSLGLGIGINTLQSLRRAASFELGLRHAGTLVMGSMGILGLLLAMVGLHGVMAYVAAARTPEVRIRMVPGASASRIRRDMLQRALAIVGTGALAGAIASAITMPLLTTMPAGVSPFDPVSFAGAAGILMLVGLTATCVPVHRTSRVDPVRAIRHRYRPRHTPYRARPGGRKK